MGRQLISYMVSSGLVALAEAVPNAMGGYSVNVFWTTEHGDAAEATGADKLEFDGSVGNWGSLPRFELECGHPCPDGYGIFRGHPQCGECAKVPHPRTNPEKWRFS